MTPKSFLALAGTTAAAVVLAVLTSSNASYRSVTADRGEPLFKGLIGQSKSIAEIAITNADGTITLKRDGTRFVEAETGYPVRQQAVRALVSGLALMRIEERKTDRAERFGDLDLASPDAKAGAGTRVTLKGEDGRAIVDMISGKQETSVGGTRGGQYARSMTDTQAYLVRGTVSTPINRIGWFDTRLTSVPTDRILKVSAEGVHGDDFDVARNGKTLALVNVPEGRAPVPDKIFDFAKLATPLTFEDVRKATSKAPEGPTFRISTKGGGELTLAVVDALPEPAPSDTEKAGAAKTDDAKSETSKTADSKPTSDAPVWVRLSVKPAPAAKADDKKADNAKDSADKNDPAAAKPKPAAATDPLQALVGKVDGVAFQLPKALAEKVRMTVADLTSAAKPKAAQPAGKEDAEKPADGDAKPAPAAGVPSIKPDATQPAGTDNN